MQVDSECNVAAQCAAAATAIAERRWADVFRHANHITRYAKATICNEMDVANATAAIRAVTDAFEDAFSGGHVVGPRTVPLWEYDEGAGRAALTSNLRKVLALAASACSVIGNGAQVVQAKRCIANTMGLPLNALAREGEPFGCFDRYFEPSVIGPPYQLRCNEVRKELRTAGARIIVDNRNGNHTPSECVAVHTLKNKVIKFVQDASTLSPLNWALSDVRSGVITDITDNGITIFVNPVPGLEAGYFTTLHFWDGIQRKDDGGQDLPEASWHWRASWDAVDTNALSVCVDDEDEPLLLLSI